MEWGIAKIRCSRAGALVSWLWEETYVPRVVVWTPVPFTGRTFFSHLFVVKIVMFAWKDENKWKRGRGWPIFNNSMFKLWRRKCFWMLMSRHGLNFTATNDDGKINIFRNELEIILHTSPHFPGFGNYPL